MLKTLFPFKTKRTKKRENEKFSVSRAGGKSNKRDKQPNHAWKSILRVSFFVPLLRLAILLCSLMSIRLFIERVYMAIVILCVKVLRKKRYTRYSLEAMKDVELNKSHPMLLVQIPMYNEKEVYKLSIGAACGLSWPSPRLIVQVLDVSTNEVLRELIEFECRKWIEKGVNVKYETRNNRNGYKAGALKEVCQNCEFMVIFDANFQPDKDFLWRTVPYLLENPELGLVQARWKFVNADECLVTRLQEMSLDYDFNVEQEVGPRLVHSLASMGLQVFGGFKPLMMLVDGKIEPQWKTWILRARNFSLWGTLQQVSQLDPVPALVTLDSKTATSHFHVLIPLYEMNFQALSKQIDTNGIAGHAAQPISSGDD
ncbi:Glycosyltransferase 2-like - like 3 [Theobroma cacao]|nr:Glycosyltransferase 2-like - like 3 [Theobroma cacao]